jgi:hypothetical protein
MFGNMRLLQVHAPRFISLDRRREHACIPDACTGSYEAARIPAFSLTPTLEEMCLCLQKSWGQELSWGSGVIFDCLEFFRLDISLGGWRKAVSRMAAPRDLVSNHR